MPASLGTRKALGTCHNRCAAIGTRLPSTCVLIALANLARPYTFMHQSAGISLIIWHFFRFHVYLATKVPIHVCWLRWSPSRFGTETMEPCSLRAGLHRTVIGNLARPLWRRLCWLQRLLSTLGSSVTLKSVHGTCDRLGPTLLFPLAPQLD